MATHKRLEGEAGANDPFIATAFIATVVLQADTSQAHPVCAAPRVGLVAPSRAGPDVPSLAGPNISVFSELARRG
jgi:hypothetical protein